MRRETQHVQSAFTQISQVIKIWDTVEEHIEPFFNVVFQPRCKRLFWIKKGYAKLTLYTVKGTDIDHFGSCLCLNMCLTGLRNEQEMPSRPASVVARLRLQTDDRCRALAKIQTHSKGFPDTLAAIFFHLRASGPTRFYVSLHFINNAQRFPREEKVPAIICSRGDIINIYRRCPLEEMRERRLKVCSCSYYFEIPPQICANTHTEAIKSKFPTTILNKLTFCICNYNDCIDLTEGHRVAQWLRLQKDFGL